MNRFVYILILTLMISCKGNENKEEAGSNDTISKGAAQSEYTCPMHPEIVSQKPDDCSKCGMELQVKS